MQVSASGPSFFDSPTFHVHMIPKNDFGKLGTFWQFIVLKLV